MNRISISSRLISLLALLVLTGCGGNPVRDKPAKTELTYAGDYAGISGALSAGDLGRGEKLLREVTTREPDHAAAWANLGMVLMHTGKTDEAVAALEQAVSINSQLAPALNQLGVLYRRTGRLADAEKVYQQALDADPDNALTHRNLGVLYDVYLGRPAEALAHYQRAIELNPGAEQLAGWITELDRRIHVMEAAHR